MKSQPATTALFPLISCLGLNFTSPTPTEFLEIQVSGDPGFWRSRFLEIQVSGDPGFSPTPTEAPPLLQSDSPLPQSGSPASATERHACLRSPDLTSPLVSSPPGFSTWILHLDFSSLSSSFLPSLYLPPTGE